MKSLVILLILESLLIIRCILECIYLFYALKIGNAYVATLTKNRHQRIFHVFSGISFLFFIIGGFLSKFDHSVKF